MALVRNPALWTGLALIALGGGNWINGQVKLAGRRQSEHRWWLR